jgi:hypothetical protein
VVHTPNHNRQHYRLQKHHIGTRSRKIILVISSSFLKSKWGKYELEMARMHMFQQNREMLIVIILEDMSINRMPTRLSSIVISDIGFYNVYKVF